ncbi:MAG: hypothetical protein K9K38_13445 [Rhodoferax sp.]|nr:hypothetical protein [Rhodoferax sp.]MCF8210384.1 hypothetical protein [Rhodoferax sp.]
MSEHIESLSDSDHPKESPSKTVLRLNDIQVMRLEALVKRFKKREKKDCYVNAKTASDETEAFRMLSLSRGQDKTTKIQRNTEVTSEKDRRDFGRFTNSEVAHSVAEHAVLDLFLTACKKVPGFELASSKRYKEKPASLFIKTPLAPIAYSGKEPPLKFDSPLFERREAKLGELCNALAVGSTGSGKTVSFIEPALSAMLSYRLADGKTAAMLVIDPKIELLESIKAKLADLGELERLVVLGQCDPIAYFDPDDGVNLVDRFEKVKSFTPITADNAEDNRWQIFAEQFIVAFLKDDQKFFDASGQGLLESVVTLATGDTSYLEINQWMALRKLLYMGMDSAENRQRLSDIYDVLTVGVGMSEIERPLARYLALRDGNDQYFYNARGALTIVENLGSEDAAHLMDFSVRRGKVKKSRTEIAKLIDRGAVLVYQPQSRHSHETVGRALKSLFFRSVMERVDMLRPTAYFCDEFQRFITVDPETGDNNFLDRCRAFRCNSFLATQSIASLLAATAQSYKNSSCLDSILVNTPTKLCFRTPDLTTLETMMGFIPPDPRGNFHVLTKRPPASLKTGECYYTVQDSWGRARYQPIVK